MIPWQFLAFTAIMGGLLYLHFYFAHSRWRRVRGANPSDIDVNYVRREDYFAQSFRCKAKGWLELPSSNGNGTGVTFYNTASSGHPPGSVDISGGPTGALSAPRSGTMEAILFFGDRTVSWSGSSKNNNINGGGTLALEGTMYFPTTNLTFGGNNSPTGTYTILIADTITFGGTSTVRNDFSSLFPDGSPLNRVRLAE